MLKLFRFRISKNKKAFKPLMLTPTATEYDKKNVDNIALSTDEVLALPGR